MLSNEDKALWDAFSKTVTPLGKASRFKALTSKLAPRFWLMRKAPVELPTTLDLHGFTLNEAHSIFMRFLSRHQELGTRRIQVITGKGKEGKGLLKAEFPGWLDRADVCEKIQSVQEKHMPDGGAFELTLKQRKK